MATIKDVAAAAGVSVATVSRVVNDGGKVGQQTRERVRRVMAELGYRPNANARALVTRHSPTLGVVLSELTDPFFATLAGGVEQVARRHNMQMLLSTGYVKPDTERRAIETLLEQRCEALVVHAKALDDATLLRYAEQVPGMVLINRYLPALASRCVWLDNSAGGAIAARYLLSQGHRHIACVTSSYDIEDPHLRLDGVRQALAEASLELVAVEAGDPNEQGGELATQNLLAKGTEMTAIIAYNDVMASGILSVLRDNGLRVPEEISVIGFDDVLLARYLTPRLTTLRYPIEMMAMEAASMALTLTQGGEVAASHLYTPPLVKRHSVAAPGGLAPRLIAQE